MHIQAFMEYRYDVTRTAGLSGGLGIQRQPAPEKNHTLPGMGVDIVLQVGVLFCSGKLSEESFDGNRRTDGILPSGGQHNRHGQPVAVGNRIDVSKTVPEQGFFRHGKGGFQNAVGVSLQAAQGEPGQERQIRADTAHLILQNGRQQQSPAAALAGSWDLLPRLR